MGHTDLIPYVYIRQYTQLKKIPKMSAISETIDHRDHIFNVQFLGV